MYICGNQSKWKGDKYFGEWKEDKWDGKGKYYFSNGDVFKVHLKITVYLDY